MHFLSFILVIRRAFGVPHTASTLQMPSAHLKGAAMCLEGIRSVFGRYPKPFWRMPVVFLEPVWRIPVPTAFLKGTHRVFGYSRSMFSEVSIAFFWEILRVSGIPAACFYSLRNKIL